jgi:hypothetical protein
MTKFFAACGINIRRWRFISSFPFTYLRLTFTKGNGASGILDDGKLGGRGYMSIRIFHLL